MPFFNTDNMGSVLGGIADVGNMAANIWSTAWNVKAQKKTWRREDNAVQRRAKDMMLAGINPQLAGGQPAQAGSAMKMEAPTASLENIMAAAQVKHIQMQNNLLKEQALTEEVERDAKAEQEMRDQRREARDAEAHGFLRDANEIRHNQEKRDNEIFGTVLDNLKKDGKLKDWELYTAPEKRNLILEQIENEYQAGRLKRQDYEKWIYNLRNWDEYGLFDLPLGSMDVQKAAWFFGNKSRDLWNDRWRLEFRRMQ